MQASLSASPEAAERIFKEFNAKNAAWQKALSVVSSPELRAQAMGLKPDPNVYAQRIWPELKNNLDKEWALPYITWLIPNLKSVDAKGLEPIRQCIEGPHLFSGEVGKTVIALATLGGPDAVKLAKTVKEKNPDPRVKGECSLALALMLSGVDDGPQITKERLQLLRDAIIHSLDSKYGDTTVGEIAEEEIYRIQHLSKGRTAPELVGVDEQGAAMKLSDYRGKVVILTFWSSSDAEYAKTIELLRGMKDALAKQEIETIGVNTDTLEKLRELAGSGAVTWKNFSDPKGATLQLYRINNMPTTYVLDKKGAIVYSGVPGSFAEMAAIGLVNEKAAVKEIRLDQ